MPPKQKKQTFMKPKFKGKKGKKGKQGKGKKFGKRVNMQQLMRQKAATGGFISRRGNIDTRQNQKVISLSKALNGYSSNLDMNPVLQSRKMYAQSEQNRYFRSVIHPESGRGSRIPADFPIATATFHDVQRFDVTTNASGDCAWVIYPQPGPALAYNHNDNAFDPEVGPNLDGIGVVVANQHWKPPAICPPAQGGLADPACYQYRTVSLAANFIGTQSLLQTSGQILHTLLQTPMYVDKDASRDYLQRQVFTNTVSANKQLARVIYVPRDPADIMFYPIQGMPTGYSCFLIFIFSGFQPNTNIGSLTLTANYEFLPSKAFMGITPVSTSQEDPKAINTTVNTIENNPKLVTDISSVAHGIVKLGSKALSSQVGFDVMGAYDTLQHLFD